MVTNLTGPSALGAFLRSRRERLTPADISIPNVGRRRAQGLRREEVAALAGMSAAWYTHLEQGRDVHASETALDSLATALRLNDVERAHLHRLGRAAPQGTRQADRPGALTRAADLRPSPEVPDGTPPTIRRLLDALLPTPALVIDRYWDVVGRNAALEALLPGLGSPRTAPDGPPRNVVRYALTRAEWRAAAQDWETAARRAVAGLRASLADVLAETPADVCAATLVSQLERESSEFRRWWPEHEVWAAERPLVQTFHHETAGALEFETTLLDVRSARGVTLIAFVPCNPESAAGLQRLRAL